MVWGSCLAVFVLGLLLALRSRFTSVGLPMWGAVHQTQVDNYYSGPRSFKVKKFECYFL